MSLLKDIWNAVNGIAKGMGKTYDEQFDPVFTEMYPFVKPELPPVSCQSLALIQNEDGTDRCVSCLACEKVCPSQVITIERKRNPAGKGFVLERFDIDLVNCMYCAMCVEACPASAIVTIQDFELSTYNLQTLKADKQFLDEQGLRAAQWYSPKIGVEYREPDAGNAIHGRIVKAPVEEQPGGLETMEKARAAAAEPKLEAAPAAPAAVIAPAKPAAAPSSTATTEVKPASEARNEPTTPTAEVAERAGTAAVPAQPAPGADAAPPAPAEGERVRKPTKRWEPKPKASEDDKGGAS